MHTTHESWRLFSYGGHERPLQSVTVWKRSDGLNFVLLPLPGAASGRGSIMTIMFTHQVAIVLSGSGQRTDSFRIVVRLKNSKNLIILNADIGIAAC